MNGLALVVSTLAAGVAAFSYLRSVPARLTACAENAERVAERVRLEFDTWKAEATSILGAVQDERERALKSAARHTAVNSRARVLEQQNRPQTRDEQLVELRSRAGLLSEIPAA